MLATFLWPGRSTDPCDLTSSSLLLLNSRPCCPSLRPAPHVLDVTAEELGRFLQSRSADTAAKPPARLGFHKNRDMGSARPAEHVVRRRLTFERFRVAPAEWLVALALRAGARFGRGCGRRPRAFSAAAGSSAALSQSGGAGFAGSTGGASVRAVAPWMWGRTGGHRRRCAALRRLHRPRNSHLSYPPNPQIPRR